MRLQDRTPHSEDIVNLTDYPIHSPGSSEYHTLIHTCRKRMKEAGVCILPEFITQDAIGMMVSQTDRIVGDAYTCCDEHNAYLEKEDPGFPEDHPRRKKQRTSLDVLGYDLMGPEDGLHVLYNWDGLITFISDVLTKDVLYRMADPLAAVTVNVMHEGQHQGWHFDEAEITTSIMLQEPEAGGLFEYVPHLRDKDHARYDVVDQVLTGMHPGIRTLDVVPGTMVIFAGHYAMHRVTTVVGDKTRYMAILCFKNRPGVRNSPEVQMLFYGKTAK